MNMEHGLCCKSWYAEVQDLPSRDGLLEGWQLRRGEWKDASVLRTHSQIEFENIFDAISEIIYLRGVIRDKQVEIDILTETLEYARRIFIETDHK